MNISYVIDGEKNGLKVVVSLLFFIIFSPSRDKMEFHLFKALNYFEVSQNHLRFYPIINLRTS